MSDTKFSTGAVRSADADKFSFTSLPMIGLLALARTAGEGAEKYGRFNYLQGMPLHDLMEHSFKHLVMYNAGDRSEPHLAHAAWGLLVAIQEEALRPEAHTPHMLGAGCSITPEMQAHMDEQKPVLAANRAESDPDDFTWNIFDLADVRKLRDQRDGVNATLAQLKVNEADQRAEYAKAVKAALSKYIKNRKPFRAVVKFDGKPVFDSPIVACNLTPEAKQEIGDALAKSRDTSALTWLSEYDGISVIPPEKPCPRTESHIPARHSHSPLADAAQNKNATGFVTYPEMDGETTQSTPGGYFPVKQHKAGGNPEAFDYYDPNTKTTKTKLDHPGGCPPL